MHFKASALTRLALATSLIATAFAGPAVAQETAENPLSSLPAGVAFEVEEPVQVPEPRYVNRDDPWLYRGSDIPQDEAWLMGELPNGLRYGVRENGVPPDQLSVRVRIDAGSLHERDGEQGFAHLLEHMVFRESAYLGQGEAFKTWQRLGASFGSDTNARTTPTETVYLLDLPNIDLEKVDTSMKLLSGMMAAPAILDDNLELDRAIVLSERRDFGGAAKRVTDAGRTTFFAGQRLAERDTIGTLETLQNATPQAVDAFHKRWYRPENVVISVAGDLPAETLAGLVEKWFGTWRAAGVPAEAPDFGDPVAPAGATGSLPVGETRVLVEPDLPRNVSYAIARPWRPVVDTVRYNQGLMLDSIAQSIINRRLEKRARGNAGYYSASVEQSDISRSADMTFVSVVPLDEDWRAALADARAVIADALTEPPTQEEIDREVSEIEVYYANQVEQAPVEAARKVADSLVEAVDIRETTTSPQGIAAIFESGKPLYTPENVLARTRALFSGTVMRGLLSVPDASEADEGALAVALNTPVNADSGARLAAATISFDDLPPVGEPGEVVATNRVGLFDIEQVSFDNGVQAMLWPNSDEPGRVEVKVRFGSGWRAFDAADAPYAAIGQSALIESGVGELGIEELDRIRTGRKIEFDFSIEEGVFSFGGQTRREDLSDQLYLFAAKLADPRWDRNPVIRTIAGSRLGYESYSTSPDAVLERDLEYLIRGKDERYKTPDPGDLEGLTPEGFRAVWEPLLQQGPVEVQVFGDFDRTEALETLSRTFGALPPRAPIPEAALERGLSFPSETGAPSVLYHRGDAEQASVVMAWPTGGGFDDPREARQLEILTEVLKLLVTDELREALGAAYTPFVYHTWPNDVASGGSIRAFANVAPENVGTVFDAMQRIADDLVEAPPSEDTLQRAPEPLSQLIRRALSGNRFWMWQLEGATQDRRRYAAFRTLQRDMSETTPAEMQALAKKYLSRPGWKLAVIPEGQELATDEGG